MTSRRRMRSACATLLGAALLALAACGTGSADGNERLHADTFAEWQAYLEPDADELAFQRIPWLATYVDGVQRADAERKPLLLWVMNGHPLGCT